MITNTFQYFLMDVLISEPIANHKEGSCFINSFKGLAEKAIMIFERFLGLCISWRRDHRCIICWTARSPDIVLNKSSIRIVTKEVDRSMDLHKFDAWYGGDCIPALPPHSYLGQLIKPFPGL